MALDIANATIQSSNTALSIIANGITGLNIDSSNRPILSKRPSFFVDKSGSWFTWTNNTYATIIFDNVVWDNCSCYNTSTGRFTAPVSGTYYFASSCYINKTTSDASTYVHPLFIVNGGGTNRSATSGGEYRIRGRTYYNGGYSADTQINNIYRLTAGDYVELYMYTATCQVYGPESFFSGTLIA